MADFIFNKAKEQLGPNEWVNGDVKLLIVDGSQSITAAMDFVSEITSELSVSGYARTLLSNRIVEEDDGANQSYWKADPTTTPKMSAGETAKAGILFLQGSSDADSVLICYMDSYFNLPDGIPTNGSSFTFDWGNGSKKILTLS